MQNLIVDYEFEAFSSRKSFNRNLKHFKSVNAIINSIQEGGNLAEAVQDGLQENSLEVNQISPLILALLVDKYGYSCVSYNLKATITGVQELAQDFSQWNAVDLVLVHHHPELGLLVINPKSAAHWAVVGELKKNELVSVYVGGGASFEKLKTDKTFQGAVKAALERSVKLLKGEKGKAPAALLQGSFTYKAPKKKTDKQPAVKATTAKPPKAQSGKKVVGGKTPLVTLPTGPAQAPQAVASAPLPQSRQVATVSGRMTVSPKVPIQVTNELFHNGNVEAWKRIIESYSVKYPTYKVTIYYDGEIIHDINSLFKWGKVKHGTSILFSISAPEEKIADLSKIRKYLLEGASPRFEVFLRGAPGKTLELF